MIVTLAIITANVLVAALGRKRKMGFGKAFMLTLLLTPLLSLPLILRSKKLPAKPKDPPEKPPQVTDGSLRESGNRYGYKEGGPFISDSIILSQGRWSSTMTCTDGYRVPPERQRQVEQRREQKDNGVHI